MTVGTIWSVSVPCAAGAAIFTLCDWTRLENSKRAMGLVPWAIVLFEVTIALPGVTS